MKSIRINGIKITAWEADGLHHVRQETTTTTTTYSTPIEEEAKAMFDKFLKEAKK